MQFLKTLFWVAIAVALVLFATVNWHAVTLTLWGGLEADVKLPVLVVGAFLLGFLPMLLFHRAKTWSLKRRMEGLERQIASPYSSAAPSAAPATASLASPPEPILVDTRTAPSS